VEELIAENAEEWGRATAYTATCQGGPASGGIRSAVDGGHPAFDFDTLNQ